MDTKRAITCWATRSYFTRNQSTPTTKSFTKNHNIVWLILMFLFILTIVMKWPWFGILDGIAYIGSVVLPLVFVLLGFFPQYPYALYRTSGIYIHLEYWRLDLRWGNQLVHRHMILQSITIYKPSIVLKLVLGRVIEESWSLKYYYNKGAGKIITAESH